MLALKLWRRRLVVAKITARFVRVTVALFGFHFVLGLGVDGHSLLRRVARKFLFHLRVQSSILVDGLVGWI